MEKVILCFVVIVISINCKNLKAVTEDDDDNDFMKGFLSESQDGGKFADYVHVGIRYRHTSQI